MSLLKQQYALQDESWIQGAIQVRAAAAWFDSSVHGTAEQDIPNPAGVQVGDTLFVLIAEAKLGAFAGPIAPSAGWSVVASGIAAPAFGRYQLYWKVADGTGADVFRLPYDGAPAVPARIAQMVAITNDGYPGTALSMFDETATYAASDADWDVATIGVGIHANNTALILVCCRDAENATYPISGSVVDNNPETMETLGEHFVQRDTNPEDALWAGWYFIFQPTSAAMAAFEQGYAPDPTTADDSWTSYTRYRQV